MPRSRASILTTLLGVVALTTGCVPMPPAVVAPVEGDDPPVTTAPITPTDPAPTDPAPTDPTDPSPTQPPGDLPASLPLDEQLPAGNEPVWGTLLYGDPRYEELEDNDFPLGPTLMLEDTEGGCQIYATTAEGTLGSDDLSASTVLLCGILGYDAGDTFDATEIVFEPDLLSTTSVTFVTAPAPDGNGTFAVRNHGAIGVAQIAGVNCDDEEAELAYLEELASGVLFPSFLPA